MSPETNLHEGEKDYSTYVGWMNSQKGRYEFIAGFTFTTITLLIISFPNSKSVVSQLMLLFINVVFDLLLYLVMLIGIASLEFVKNIPPYTKTIKLANDLSNLTLTLWGFTVPVMFLLGGFEYLAILSTVIWIIVAILTYVTLEKLYVRLRRVTIA